MTSPAITVEPAERGDLDRIETLLDENDLPFQDVRSKPESFFVATFGETFVGVGGVERYGSDGLLRSVVVTESSRGQGYGTALCDELEQYARTKDVTTLYLLTTTAAAFFRRRGYEEIDRAAAPQRIRRTTEFADLCPTSAPCMRKHL